MHDPAALMIKVFPIAYLILQVLVPFRVRGDYRRISFMPLILIIIGALGLFLMATGPDEGWGIFTVFLFLTFAIPAGSVFLAGLWIIFVVKNRNRLA